MNFWLLLMVLVANGSELHKSHEQGKEWTRKPRKSSFESLFANQFWKYGEDGGKDCDTKATYSNGYCREFCDAGETEWRASIGIHTLPLQCIGCEELTHELIFPWTGGLPRCDEISAYAIEIRCEGNTNSKDCWDCSGDELGKHCEGEGAGKECRAVCYWNPWYWSTEKAFVTKNPRKEFKSYGKDLPKDLCCPEDPDKESFPLIGGHETGPYLCYDESKNENCLTNCNSTFYKPHQCGGPDKLVVPYE